MCSVCVCVCVCVCVDCSCCMCLCNVFYLFDEKVFGCITKLTTVASYCHQVMHKRCEPVMLAGDAYVSVHMKAKRTQDEIGEAYCQ